MGLKSDLSENISSDLRATVPPLHKRSYILRPLSLAARPADGGSQRRGHKMATIVASPSPYRATFSPSSSPSQCLLSHCQRALQGFGALDLGLQGPDLPPS